MLFKQYQLTALKLTNQLCGTDSTLCMHTTLSPRQWQPWTAVGAHQHRVAVGSMSGGLPAYQRPFFVETSAKHSFKRQLHHKLFKPALKGTHSSIHIAGGSLI